MTDYRDTAAALTCLSSSHSPEPLGLTSHPAGSPQALGLLPTPFSATPLDFNHPIMPHFSFLKGQPVNLLHGFLVQRPRGSIQEAGAILEMAAILWKRGARCKVGWGMGQRCGIQWGRKMCKECLGMEKALGTLCVCRLPPPYGTHILFNNPFNNLNM